MRITGNRLMEINARAVTRNQARVGELAAEVSSGVRVAKPSDDPGAWVASHRVGMHRALAEGAVTALGSARARIDETDAAIAGLGDIVSQVRTITVQGASDSYTAQDRAGLAEQVRLLFRAALDQVNKRGPDGEYLLAGTQSLAAPFDATGAYVGDAVDREVPTDELGAVGYAVSGNALTAASGGVDVLPLLDRIATALAANDTPTLVASLGQLDQATSQVSALRTRVGTIMSVLQDTTDASTSLRDALDAESARLVQSDTVSAASELARASDALEVSRSVAASVANTLARATSG